MNCIKAAKARRLEKIKRKEQIKKAKIEFDQCSWWERIGMKDKLVRNDTMKSAMAFLISLITFIWVLLYPFWDVLNGINVCRILCVIQGLVQLAIYKQVINKHEQHWIDKKITEWEEEEKDEKNKDKAKEQA